MGLFVINSFTLIQFILKQQCHLKRQTLEKLVFQEQMHNFFD
jgi:hypothetical protein